MLSLITALLFVFPMLNVAQQLHTKPLSKPKKPSVENRKANPQGEKTATDQAIKSPNAICNGCLIEEVAGAQKGTQEEMCVRLSLSCLSFGDCYRCRSWACWPRFHLLANQNS